MLAVFSILPELLANFSLTSGVIPQQLGELRQRVAKMLCREREIHPGWLLLLMSHQRLLGLIKQRLCLLLLVFQRLFQQLKTVEGLFIQQGGNKGVTIVKDAGLQCGIKLRLNVCGALNVLRLLLLQGLPLSL